MQYEQGEEVGKGAWMWKGGRVGPGRCWPPRAFGREGVPKKAMTFVFCASVDLHAISSTPFLHGLQLARTSGHEREVIYVQ